MATPAQLMQKKELTLAELAKMGIVEERRSISIDISGQNGGVFFQKKGGIAVRVGADMARKLVRG